MATIVTKQINKVLYLTLNRPIVRNAFNPEMIRELTQIFRTLPEGVRVLVLRGQGTIFCAGADLDWMKSMVQFSEAENRKDSAELFELFQALQDCVVPVITVVQGAAMGGAIGLLACSDLVLAESNCQFCFSEVRLGLAPAVISHFILERINVGAVSPWMISGKTFGVSEALQMNLVHGAGSQESVENQLDQWIEAFGCAAPQAVMETKKLLRILGSKTKDEAKQLTTALIASRRVSDEGQAGLKSFLEKRPAPWRESIR